MMESIEIEGKTELELALQVSLLVNEKTDQEAFAKDFNQFVEAIRREIEVTDKVDHFLAEYRRTGFMQEKQVEMQLWHSDIVRVFEAKEGIPITLGILLIETAKRCGFEAQGVNYPGHFLVKIDGQLVDPMGLVLLDSKKLEKPDKESEGLLVPVSPLIVLLRMLNNLRALYGREEQWNKSIEIIDLQLQVSKGNDRLKASLFFDKAELWSKMGVYGIARECFLAAAEMTDNRDFIDQCQERVIELSIFEQVVH